MFEKELISLLSANATLCSYLSTYGSPAVPAIFSQGAPEAAALPYLVCRISTDADDLASGNLAIQNFIVSIDYYDIGGSWAVARRAMECVEYLLDRAEFNSTRYNSIRLFYFSGSGIEDPDPTIIHYSSTFDARASRAKWIEYVSSETGIIGYTGFVGTTWISSQGATGAQGVTGLAGIGTTGLQGATGLSGGASAQGATGAQGETGLAGVAGLGTTGLTGATGAQGETGLNGSQGLQGATGAQGETGLDGTAGTQGTTGLNGATGLQGTTGLQGSTGIQGSTGLQGFTGISGIGETGAQGATGIGGGGSAFSTFAPTVTIVGSGTVPVYATNSGRYCTTGKLCFVYIILNGDGGDEGSGGAAVIHIALPVTAGSNALTVPAPAGIYTNGAASGMLYASVEASATTCALSYQTSSTARVDFTADKQNNTTRNIVISFNYEID